MKIKRWKKQKPTRKKTYLPNDFGLTSNCEICGVDVNFVHIVNDHEHIYCEEHQEETARTTSERSEVPGCQLQDASGPRHAELGVPSDPMLEMPFRDTLKNRPEVATNRALE